jgi:hypothetical protein
MLILSALKDFILVNMLKTSVYPLVLLIAVASFAQEKATLSGYIKDAADGEALIGATVYIRSLNTGSTTNVYGFYSVTLPKGEYEIEFTYVGYSPIRQTISLQQNVRLDVELSSQSKELQEVVVSAAADRSMVETVQMSVNKIDIGTIKKIPAFLGEVDVIRSL